jgi:hypothetical protein
MRGTLLNASLVFPEGRIEAAAPLAEARAPDPDPEGRGVEEEAEAAREELLIIEDMEDMDDPLLEEAEAEDEAEDPLAEAEEVADAMEEADAEGEAKALETTEETSDGRKGKGDKDSDDCMAGR